MAKEKRKRGPLGVMWWLLGLVMSIAFGFVLICNLTIIIKGAITPDVAPSVFGVTPMVTLSGSMSGNAEDHIEVGDMIFAKAVEADTLEVGDVISYMVKSTIVTHRIIEVQQGENGVQFITKGDANNAADEAPVTAGQIVGQYVYRIPKMGDVVLFAKEPAGLLLFLGAPIALYLLYDVTIRRGARKREREAMEEELRRLRAKAGEDEY